MPVTPAVLPGKQAILEALRWRYATKEFDAKVPVSDEDLETILESIRLAPTSRGLQPFQVVLVTDPATKSAIRKVAFNQPQTESASHLLVFCARPDISDRAEKLFAYARQKGTPEAVIAQMQKNVKLGNLLNLLTFSRKSWAARQAYIALGYATMTAAQLGVDCCPMEGFLPGKVAKILQLPKGLHPVALLALGYRSSSDSVRTKYRLPIEELVIRA